MNIIKHIYIELILTAGVSCVSGLKKISTDHCIWYKTHFSTVFLDLFRRYINKTLQLIALLYDHFKIIFDLWNQQMTLTFMFLVFNRLFYDYYINIYIYAFSRRFYPKRLTVHSGYPCFITMCVPWESNPQPFALLTQCSTTEPQEHCLLFDFYLLIN